MEWESVVPWINVVVLVGAWLLGGLPTGLWLARWQGAPDPTRPGSGSSGATNVGRLLGWRWGLLVLALDLLKGLLAGAVPLALGAGETVAALAGLAAVLGHCASPWARFRGGKGVATGAGAALAQATGAALLALPFLVAVLVATRRMAPASLAGTAAFAALAALPPWTAAGPFWFGPALLAVVVVTHRQNLGRLARGVEPTLWGKPAGDPRWRQAEEEPADGVSRGKGGQDGGRT